MLVETVVARRARHQQRADLLHLLKNITETNNRMKQSQKKIIIIIVEVKILTALALWSQSCLSSEQISRILFRLSSRSLVE